MTQSQILLAHTTLFLAYTNFKHTLISLKVEKQYNQNFTIVLNNIIGSSELFHSFNDTNPQNVSEYPTEGSLESINESPNQGSYFYMGENEVIGNSSRNIQLDSKTKYYQVTNPDNIGRLYLGVKGLGDENKFQIYIFNRSVWNDNELHTLSQSSVMHGSSVYTIMIVIIAACNILFFI